MQRFYLYYRFISKTIFMADNTRKRNDQPRKQSSPEQPQNAKRSGQETAGKRGQKQGITDSEGYRSREQNKKSGTRGGNR